MSRTWHPVVYFGRGSTALFDELSGKGIVVHPMELVTREMTKGEIKRVERAP